MKKILFLFMFVIPLFAQHTDRQVQFGTTLSADGMTVSGITTTLTNSGVYYSSVYRFDLIEGTYGVGAYLAQLTGSSTYKLEVRLYSAVTGFGDWNTIFSSGTSTDALHTFMYTTESWWKPPFSGTQYRLTGAGTGTADIKITETVR